MKKFLSVFMLILAIRARAEVPTISLGAINGVSSLSNPTFYSITNSLFSFPGVRPAITNYNGMNYYYPLGDTHPSGVMMPMKVGFNINAQSFEVLCFGGYPMLMVYNPPDYTPLTNSLASAMGQGYTWVRVNFSTKASRNIIFYLSGSQGNFIGGVNVQAGDTIATNTLGPRKKLEVLGDSYTEGYSQTDAKSRWLGGFAMQVERWLTNVDVIPAGVGGTGYAWPGATNAGTTNYLGRFWTDVVSNNPDYLIINGGLNDASFGVTTNAFQNAVTNLYALAKANLPNTKIGVVGNFFVTTYYAPFLPPDSRTLAFDQIIGQAATNYGLPFIDAIAGNWLNTNNFSSYMGGDNIHPTIAGYSVIASNLVAALPTALPGLPVTSGYYNSFANGQVAATNGVGASATFSATPVSGSAPLLVNFTYSGTNGSVFAWAFGDGGTSTAANPVYTYTTPGTYTVSLVVNGSVSNAVSGMITVTNPALAAASATFSASSTLGGAPKLVNFTYTGTNGTSFAWAFGDGGASTAQNPAYVYASPGSFTVSLVVNGNVTNSLANLITVTNTTSGTASGTSLNVTNYGAVGDAVQFYVNTVSNSVWVTTTNVLPVSSIGDAIEIFSAGPQTYGANSSGTNAYGNQDLVATITNVVNGTNIYISLPARNSLVNTFATYGHNNRANFQNALNAAGTNTTVNIPAGNFLILAGTNAGIYGDFGLVLNQGGITINGAGPASTKLLSQGAWSIQGGNVWRGILFEENPPIANNLPFTLQNLTLDGGVPQGNTSFHGYPANTVDGQGWDGTHDAFLVWSYNNSSAFNQMTWTNLVFQHWRGEMVKSIDQSTNGNLLVENCIFQDGDATAINIYPSINFTNCLFNNLFQVAEYYQAYSTNTCYFQNNLCTNITGNTFAINGGKGSNPSFVFRGNTFCPSQGFNGIETTPGDNIIISNNTFVCQNFANAVVLGCVGYQGSFDNSNIVITANTIINPYVFVEIASGATGSDPNRVESVSVLNNKLLSANHYPYLLLDYGWSTNVTVSGNDCSQFNNLASSVMVQPGTAPIPYALVDTSNLYYTWCQSGNPVTNVISYGAGSRYYTSSSVQGTAYLVQNSDSNQIPAGAQILFNNQNSFNVPLYLNSVTGARLTVTNGMSVTVNWLNGQWVVAGTNSPSNVAPSVSAVIANVPNMGTNPSVYAVAAGPVQLSATASASAGDAIAWQWSDSMNGGPSTVYSTGSGPNPVAGLTNNPDSGGNTNLWTLQVTDTSNGLSAQSQIKLFVMLPPPQGVQINLRTSSP